MSDTEHAELKGGHAPAMMVGGRRVPLPKHHEEKPAENPKEEAEAGEEKKNSPNKTVVISGAQIKEKDIYSPESARAIHEKPKPTREYNATGSNFTGYGSSASQTINQPRKS